MKVRTQVANPCEKKGDKRLGSPFCECIAPCKNLKDFLKPESKGTIQHQRIATTTFKGCLPLEEELISDNLIRYETREIGGLEVLFEGIETTQNLNAEIFMDDGVPSSLSTYLDGVGNFLTDSYDNDRNLKKATSSDEGLRDFLPGALGFAQSGANAFAARAPESLKESFFQTMYARGDFERETDDVQNLSACLFHRVDLPKEIKKIWPRYTEKRHQETIAKIWAIVHKKMPPWAKKFDRIWDRLSDAQAEALRLEWFYKEDEKPTQEENAKRLGISIPSYQERLEWAYKKLEDLYPEMVRRRRKSPLITHEVKNINPLFKILPNGEKLEIEKPEAKNKKLSATQLRDIKKWVYLSTGQFIFTQVIYTDVDDSEDEDELEEIEEEIEKEHQDFLKLKTEAVELTKKVTF